MRIETGEWTLPADYVVPSAQSSWVATARRELWRYLPAWMFFIYGDLLLNTELTNLEPARPDLAWTMVFPISVFLAFTATRSLYGRDVQRRTTMLAVTTALALGLPMATMLWHRPSPLAIDDLRFWYELSNFFWAGLLVTHAWRHQRSHVPLFFGVAFAYGVVLENGGIVLGFFHETNLPLTMAPPLVAPFATMIGWSVVLYMATFVVWQLRKASRTLRKSALLSALLVALAATLLDLQIDPLATAAGCWVWHDTLPGWFHGVPLVNFVAWTCAIFPFAYVMFRYQERAGLADRDEWSRKHLLGLFKLVPATLTLAALLFLACTVLLEGADGPSWTLLNGFTSSALAVVGL